jgi:hypothetical protein
MMLSSFEGCCNCWRSRQLALPGARADCTEFLIAGEAGRRCYPSAPSCRGRDRRFSWGAERMKSSRKLALLLALLVGLGTTGCTYKDPFYRCDNRRSLADWFDEYGPLGCSCNHGNCGCNSCRDCGCER